MTNLTYILKPNTSLTVLLNGKLHTINASHPNFNTAVEAVKNKDIKALNRAVDVIGTISKFSYGRISVKDNEVYFDNIVTHNACAKKILEYLKLGLDCKPLIAFLERLLVGNPSKKAVDSLWEYVEKYEFPIDEEGYFYAAKAIRNDWTDKWTGKIDNHVGQKPRMPRNEVADVDVACGPGLHCGNLYGYVLGYYGQPSDRVIVVKFAPEDVVAIPTDCSCQKIRGCGYEVVNYLGLFEELKDKNEAVFTNNSIKTKSQIAAEPKPVAKTPNYHNLRDKNGKFVKKARKFKHKSGLFDSSCNPYWVECRGDKVEFVYSSGERKESKFYNLGDCLSYVKIGSWVEF